MSEVVKSETPKITLEKVKDPQRVEAGKRLSQISKEARERKMEDKIREKIETEEGSNYSTITWGNMGLILGVTLGIVSLYYACRADARGRAKNQADQLEAVGPLPNSLTPAKTNTLDS